LAIHRRTTRSFEAAEAFEIIREPDKLKNLYGTKLDQLQATEEHALTMIWRILNALVKALNVTRIVVPEECVSPRPTTGDATL
jgi:hypothetical protein